MNAIAFNNLFGGRKLDFHKDLVYPTNISSVCDVCSNSEERASGEGGYICKPCNLFVHKHCVEIINLNYHKHPLKLLKYTYGLDYERKCLLCGESVKRFFYHCSLCDITLCKLCLSKPLVIEDIPKKVHKHSLTQMMIKVSFTCDACGVCKDGFPCVCLQCCFIIHRDCIKLPRVIHINRHDHRVYHVYSLGPGDWLCVICRKGIDRLYGAYSCLKSRFAVHSQCATREDVWDGIELEDVPEDENEDLDPFEVIGEGLIKYFSHEHDLKLQVNSGKEENNGHCYACALAIYSEPFYTCMECHFIIHQECANFPKKKRHEIDSHQFTLCTYPLCAYPGLYEGFFYCLTCDRKCTGFSYENEHKLIDIRCAEVSKTFNHGSHPHPLFYLLTESKVCNGCSTTKYPLMSCIECGFHLCFYCATLPKEVRHKYDRHPLSLCYGEDAKGLYWCEICEGETNPNEWFYTCNDCGSTLHVDCVLGEYLHMRPGHNFTINGYEVEVVANDGPTRPVCASDLCEERCIYPYVLRLKKKNNAYTCGYRCATQIRYSSSEDEDEDEDEDGDGDGDGDGDEDKDKDEELCDSEDEEYCDSDCDVSGES